jgi:hypothetical protein
MSSSVIVRMIKDDINGCGCQDQDRRSEHGGRILALMKKDTRLTFRVSSELKKNMEAIAHQEGRSVAQICEAFLWAGSEGYGKDGGKFIHRFIRRQKS